MVKIRCSASDRIRVPARPAARPQRPYSKPDAWSASSILAYTGRDRELRCVAIGRRRYIRELTIGPAEADQARAASLPRVARESLREASCKA